MKVLFILVITFIGFCSLLNVIRWGNSFYDTVHRNQPETDMEITAARHILDVCFRKMIVNIVVFSICFASVLVLGRVI